MENRLINLDSVVRHSIALQSMFYFIFQHKLEFLPLIGQEIENFIEHVKSKSPLTVEVKDSPEATKWLPKLNRLADKKIRALQEFYHQSYEDFRASLIPLYCSRLRRDIILNQKWQAKPATPIKIHTNEVEVQSVRTQLLTVPELQRPQRKSSDKPEEYWKGDFRRMQKSPRNEMSLSNVTEKQNRTIDISKAQRTDNRVKQSPTKKISVPQAIQSDSKPQQQRPLNNQSMSLLQATSPKKLNTEPVAITNSTSQSNLKQKTTLKPISKQEYKTYLTTQTIQRQK